VNALLAEWYDRHACGAHARQRRLAGLIGGSPWRFRMKEGELSFGLGLSWQAQVLGTESEETRTWLWAWANEASNIPQPLLRAANEMRALGRQHEVRELTEPLVDLTQADGHVLAVIAVGLCGADAFYRGPYEGGAVLLLLQDPTFPRPDFDLRVEAPLVFSEVVRSGRVSDHRRAFRGYLAELGLQEHEAGATIEGRRRGETLLSARFDEAGRWTGPEGPAG
jgi:hypothetical protein